MTPKFVSKPSRAKGVVNVVASATNIKSVINGLNRREEYTTLPFDGDVVEYRGQVKTHTLPLTDDMQALVVEHPANPETGEIKRDLVVVRNGMIFEWALVAREKVAIVEGKVQREWQTDQAIRARPFADWEKSGAPVEMLHTHFAPSHAMRVLDKKVVFVSDGTEYTLSPDEAKELFNRYSQWAASGYDPEVKKSLNL